MMQIRSKLLEGRSSESEDEATQIEFANQFATLRGRITLEGSAPGNPTLKVDKDLAVCNPAGGPVVDQVVTTGPNNGLANVLIYADVPDGWCHESKLGNTDTVDFDQKNCLFLNRIFPMQTTQRLRILNSDTVGHNAAMKPSKNPEYNPNIAGGGEAIYPPGETELREEKSPFPVNCAAHPWMQSYIIIREMAILPSLGKMVSLNWRTYQRASLSRSACGTKRPKAFQIRQSPLSRLI